MLKLYYSPGSSALAPHIALEEAGAKFEAVKIELAKNEQNTPAYLAINPKARVPSLATDRGVITEVPAILVYIAQTYPAASLAPDKDPFAFAQLQAFNAYLCATVHIAHAHFRRGNRWADDPAAIADIKRKAPEVVAASYDLIERTMFKGPFVMGKTYSVADPYLFTAARWMRSNGVEIDRFPKIADHFGRMAERPAVKRAISAHGLA